MSTSIVNTTIGMVNQFARISISMVFNNGIHNFKKSAYIRGDAFSTFFA